MKKITLLLTLGICISAAYAQNTPRTLNGIRKQFLAEHARLVSEGKVEKEKKDGDGLMQQFKRWE